jgi:hypothetical protein
MQNGSSFVMIRSGVFKKISFQSTWDYLNIISVLSNGFNL